MSQDESACPSQVPARALPPFAQSGRPPSARPVCAPLLFSSVWQQLSRGAENSSPMTSGSTACTDCSSSPCQTFQRLLVNTGCSCVCFDPLIGLHHQLFRNGERCCLFQNL